MNYELLSQRALGLLETSVAAEPGTAQSPAPACARSHRRPSTRGAGRHPVGSRVSTEPETEWIQGEIDNLKGELFGDGYGPTTTGIFRIAAAEYRRDFPPGLQHGDSSYPLRSYLEKLKMWYRIWSGLNVMMLANTTCTSHSVASPPNRSTT